MRRFIVVFKREAIRVREIRCAAAFMIQRLYRGWKGRKDVEKYKIEMFKVSDRDISTDPIHLTARILPRVELTQTTWLADLVSWRSHAWRVSVRPC